VEDGRGVSRETAALTDARRQDPTGERGGWSWHSLTPTETPWAAEEVGRGRDPVCVCVREV